MKPMLIRNFSQGGFLEKFIEFLQSLRRRNFGERIGGGQNIRRNERRRLDRDRSRRRRRGRGKGHLFVGGLGRTVVRRWRGLCLDNVGRAECQKEKNQWQKVHRARFQESE